MLFKQYFLFCSVSVLFQISQAVGCVISALQRVNQLKEHIANHHYIVVLTHVCTLQCHFCHDSSNPMNATISHGILIWYNYV